MNIREGKQRKTIHLAVHFPGVDNTVGWSDSQLHLAQTAERGLFDFCLLADGPPGTFPMLAALAGVTERLGLVGTVDTTFNEPFEVARQFATLDHLSDGRAGWNVVTTSDGFTGANFRRGDYLQHVDRYRRAGEFLEVARQLWDSWDPDAVVADEAAGIYLDPSRIHSVRHAGEQFDVRGMATLPAGPQGHPVLLQAGDSAAGRDFGVAQADALFTTHSTLEAGQRFYADAHARAVAHGRDPQRLRIFARATFVLVDTANEAADYAALEQRAPLAGTPEQVAAEIDRFVQFDACDGFILAPHLTRDGLDGFVDKVVPLLAERGVFRTAYTGDSLRERLGLRAGGLTE